MTAPTKAQRDAFAIFCRYVDANGYAPTRRELATLLGAKGVQTATDHVKAWERWGWVKRKPKQWRGLTIVNRPNQGEHHGT